MAPGLDDLFGRPVPPPGPPTILFVCTGNICRSPFAEKLLRRRLAEVGVDSPHVASAGLHAVVGAPMDPTPAELVTRLGADATHVASQITAEELRSSTLVLTMSREQRREIAQEYSFALKRTFLLSEYVRLLEEGGDDIAHVDAAAGRSLFDTVYDASRFRGKIALTEADDVEDPFRRSMETHERVASRLTDLTDRLAATLTPR